MSAPTEPLLRAPLVIIDTETSGFPSKRNAHVIEVGAIYINRAGDTVAEYESIVRPPAWPDDPSEALAVSKLTREQVEDEGDDPASVLADLQQWWPTVNGESVGWTAFCLDFDQRMLRRTLGGEAVDVLGPVLPCIMLSAHAVMKRACALQWLRWKNDYKWPKAEEAMKWLGIGGEHIHRALPDARDEARILCSLARLRALRHLGAEGALEKVRAENVARYAELLPPTGTPGQPIDLGCPATAQEQERLF